MGNMKYKVGDKVRIKSIDWYNENKDEFGNISYKKDGSAYPVFFSKDMSNFCGEILTIKSVFKNSYHMNETTACEFWTDEMIEELVECDNNMSNIDKLKRISTPAEENWFEIAEEWEREDKGTSKLVTESVSGEITIKEPKYNKLSINTELCDDKVELVISPDFELKQEGDKWFAVKKKKEYPKTYEECCKVLRIQSDWHLTLEWNNPGSCELCVFCIDNEVDYVYRLEPLRKLIICRNAYWKIAGEEMGLGKPWETDWREKRHIIYQNQDDIIGGYREAGCVEHHTFEFPTKEMRDAFKENFDKYLECCKEFL